MTSADDTAGSSSPPTASSVGPRLPRLLVARPRLLSMLEPSAPLTLLRAPLGFGKTTLVAQWLRRRVAGSSETAAWLRVSADAAGSDEFWAAVLDALYTADPGLARNSRPMESTWAQVKRALDHGQRPVRLVLDEFDHVTADGVDQALLTILRDHPRLSLVVCLRRDRPFRPAQYVDIDYSLITANELLFTVEETRELLHGCGQDVSLQQATDLHAQTGGWPEPTRALALALSQFDRPGANSRPYVERDIVTSVSSAFLQERLAPELGGSELFDFALTTSVLDPFAPELAESLTEPAGQDAQKLLAALTAVGLLIPEFEDGRPVLRWPPAARAALYAEARRRDPDRVTALHRAAAEWYHNLNRGALALRHATDGGDWAQVVQVIESHWNEQIIDDLPQLKAVFLAAPAEAVSSSLLCRLTRSIVMNVPDDAVLDDLPTLPAEPEQLAQLGHEADAPTTVEVAIAVMLVLRGQGRLRPASEQASRLEILAQRAGVSHPAAVAHRLPNILLQAGVSHLHAGYLDLAQPALLCAYDLVRAGSPSYVAGDSASKLALIMAMQGYTAHTELWLGRCEAAPRKNGFIGSRILSTELGARAWTALDQLDLGTAAEVLSNVRNDLVKVRQGDWPVIAYVEALYALHTGQAERALHDLLRAATVNQSLMERGGLAHLLIGSMRAELLLAVNRANQARRLLRGLPEHPLVRVAQARLALLSDQPSDTIGLANDYQWLNVTPPRLSAEMLVLKAVAHHRSGQHDTATATLGNAISAAKPNRLRRPFATVPQAELLEIAGRLPTEAVEFLLDPALARAPAPFPDRVEVVALTERERLIMTQLAHGRRAREIAAELYLSYNTVRTYLRQIYRKLGANSREQAVDQARAYGLLPRD